MAKKNLLIQQFVSEIVFDIRNKAFLTGKSRKEKDASIIANMQASDDEEDMAQLARSVQSAYGTMLTKLSDYVINSATFEKTVDPSATNPTSNMVTVTTTKFNTGDNILCWDSTTQAFTPETLFIVLAMPGNYNLATEQTIAYAMHNYIVNKGVAEWFAITNKEDAGDYLKMSEINIQEIYEAINKRVRPDRAAVTKYYETK